MVEVQSLGRAFEGRWVLREIDFAVEPGQVLVIMGSSGGGKTTLLRCIAALLDPSEGDVLVDGRSAKREPEAVRSAIGMVFQYAALFDFLNVSENILFGVRRRRRLSSGEAKSLVADRLAEVGLSGTEAMMPSELSGGMRKRVGLARALAMDPQVLLYDEPTSGLDPVTAYSIDQLIVETRDRTGATSIVVSHDVSSVMRVADRIAFLEKGSLVFMGTPDEFRNAENRAIKDLVQKARAESLDTFHPGPAV
ncbi:MAG: ATP-binding cassette domain-containing protein [Fimbriimonadaceae bacterium]|nr:ATP-binding cassette domain-containing protein [Fimbriimonadaceae bacterium]QYK54867.1 MAG: ATP-binding cassette domain-containing protein [Fimbriimonadaceae bacterium]